MRFLLGAASAVVIVAGLRATAAILIPFVLALFLALISYPLVTWLQRHRVPRLLAVTITVLAVLATLVGPGLLVVTAIRQFVTAVPGYEAGLRQVVGAALAWFQARDIDTTFLKTFIDPARVLNLMATTLSGIVTLISVAFLVVLIAAFMLLEATDLLGQHPRVLPPSLRRSLARVAREMQVWLWIKTAISLATGLVAGLWVGFLGIDFALLWGLVAFLLNYIPTFGSLAAAFPPVLLALVQFGPSIAALVVFGYIGLNAVFGNVLEPYLMGRRIGLSPLVVLLSVIVWGWIWGVAGMLLSIPITTAIKISLASSESLSWVAQLLGTDPPSATDGGRPRAAPV